MEDETIDNQQATEIELAWLGGIWDGEGTISARFVRHSPESKQYSPRVQMVNTNPLILVKTYEILDKLGIKYHIYERGPGGYSGSKKTCWSVGINTLKHSAIFLEAVSPYLVGKLPQAKLLTKFINSRLKRLTPNKRYCKYSKQELNWLADIYDLNGNVHGASETTRVAAEKADDIVQTI